MHRRADVATAENRALRDAEIADRISAPTIGRFVSQGRGDLDHEELNRQNPAGRTKVTVQSSQVFDDMRRWVEVDLHCNRSVCDLERSFSRCRPISRSKPRAMSCSQPDCVTAIWQPPKG